jgi:hypothetical protein
MLIQFHFFLMKCVTFQLLRWRVYSNLEYTCIRRTFFVALIVMVAGLSRRYSAVLRAGLSGFRVPAGALSLGVKRPGCEADHSPTSSAEVNVWSYTSTPQYSSMASCSVEAQRQLYLTLVWSWCSFIADEKQLLQSYSHYSCHTPETHIIFHCV